MAVDILVAFSFQDGVAYPNSGAINVSAPGAQDGTEFIAVMIDNYLFGPQQALLDHAGLTPDGVIESASASQTIEALQKGFAIGPGIGRTWWKKDDPSVTGDRVLLLTGQVILITNYTDLVDAVYVGDGDNATASAFYKTSDAGGTVRDTAGTYMVLPDLRGYVLRGLDVAAAVDPNGAGRDVGSIQIDSFQGHLYNLESAVGTDNVLVDQDGTGAISNGKDIDFGGVGNQPRIETTSPVTDGVNGTPRISSESRMVNIATRFGITY